MPSRRPNVLQGLRASSYPTAPDSIHAVPWWTWVALGFFVAVVLAAGIMAALALRTLGALEAVSDRLALALEDLAGKGEELERRAARSTARVESAEPHFEHLRTTLDRFSVLTWALGDAARTASRLRSAMLVRK